MQRAYRSARTQRQSKSIFVACGWALLLIALLLLGACGRRNEPVDPLARYRPALKNDAQSQLDALGPVPRYELDVTLSEDLTQLQGVARIHVPNTSSHPWTYLIFRLYPALEQYGALFQIQSAAVNGKPVPFSYQDKNSSLRVELPAALLSGQQVNVYLSWTLEIPQWEADSQQAYRLFGYSQEMLSLPLFYPSLAVYQPGPTVESGRWWTEQGTSRGDAAHNVASLFVVTATLPGDQVPVTSGTLVTSTNRSPTQTQYVWVAGPVREFLLHSSDRFQQRSIDAYDTTVTSYWLPGQEAAGVAALQHTAAALRIYSDLFGPYPYTDLRVATAPLSFRGMEYPQVFLLGVQLYDQYRNELEIRTAHEVAHQWWYQIVHNDPVNQPWIDEGLAEYSSKLYYEAMRGRSFADVLQAQRWQTVLDGLMSRGEDAPLNQPVGAYASASIYESVVYGKGALFFDAVRQSLGDRQFRQFLRTYLQEYQYQIVTPSDLWAVLHQFNPQVADSLYRSWIGEPPAPATPVAGEETTQLSDDP